jgi:hypothetical protein
MFLTPTQLVELTGAKRRNAQIKALDYMRFKYLIRPDGTLAVLWAHVAAELGGEMPCARDQAEPEPNWDALRSFPQRRRPTKT